jgi:hypothetical protein
MKKSLFKSIAIAATLVFSSSVQQADAAVSLTFNTSTEGFSAVSWNAANGSPSWSSRYGGSLAIQTTIGGWSNPVAVLSLTSTPALQAEYAAALINGGTITFDYIVAGADVLGSAPGWFELVAIANTDSASPLGGYDQNVLGGAAGYYGAIPAGPTTKSITLGIAPGPPASDNGILNFGTASGWNEIMFGFNNESGKVTGATIFLDNLTVTANTVPEPSNVVLLGMAALGAVRTRRRKQ